MYSDLSRLRQNCWNLIGKTLVTWNRENNIILGIQIRIGWVIEFEAVGKQSKMVDNELIAMDLLWWFSISADFLTVKWFEIQVLIFGNFCYLEDVRKVSVHTAFLLRFYMQVAATGMTLPRRCCDVTQGWGTCHNITFSHHTCQATYKCLEIHKLPIIYKV